MQTPTIAEAARLIAARKLSPVELTQHCLDRIKTVDGTLHSFIQVTSERALADASAGAMSDPRIRGVSISAKRTLVGRLPCMTR